MLSLFLALILVSGWYSVHKKHRAAKALLDCTTHKWSWLATAESIAWEVQKWEVMAGQCLKVGHNPLRKAPEAGGVILDALRISQPNLRAASGPNILIVPPGSEFIAGDQLVVCTPEAVVRGVIQQIHIDAQKNVLDVSFDPPMSDPIPAGATVASVSTVNYVSEPSMNPPERILYRAQTQADRKPIAAGFDRFDLHLAPDDGKHLRGSVDFALGECVISAPLHVTPGGEESEVGRWWIRGKGMAFDPWTLAEEAVAP